MSDSLELSRRTLLRGLGTAVALPMLDAMLPRSALGANSVAAAAKSPTRVAWVYVPNGVNVSDWTPVVVGADYTMPKTLELLKDHRSDFLVLSGLTQNGARPLGDGAGDHARALASFLTGCHPRKTGGSDIKVGMSADQVAAEQIGRQTRFASLELGCEAGQQAGSCDSGYSCAYSSNISWKTESTPVAKEVNPRLVFERLFAGGPGNESDQARARRDRYQKSVLDFVREDADRLERQLGRTDRRKLDEYLTSVRELEQRITRVETIPPPKPDMPHPDGIPKEFGDHLRLMFDLLALAFQTDMTRVATFVVANEGSNRSYPSIGVNDGHHEMTHHGGDKIKLEKVAKINRFHMTEFARFIGKLKETKEAGGSVLDHSMIVYGSCIGDGDRHNHDELPILLVGSGSGTLKSGRHVRYPKDTPLNNLWLSMLDRIDVKTQKLGDSTGRLPLLDEEQRF
ncbi:MAG TPA: DUF1552 domain-containing protein [Pirellulales bacterium]